MSIAAIILILLVAALHLAFGYFEMFKWDVMGARAFGASFNPDDPVSQVMAKNQGVYNLLVAMGLIWAVVVRGATGASIAKPFLVFVILAGVYGALTVSPRIIVAQSAPALLALLVLLWTRPDVTPV